MWRLHCSADADAGMFSQERVCACASAREEATRKEILSLSSPHLIPVTRSLSPSFFSSSISFLQTSDLICERGNRSQASEGARERERVSQGVKQESKKDDGRGRGRGRDRVIAVK